MNETPQKKYSWVTWLIVILALLLVALCWRSCSERANTPAGTASAANAVSATDTTKQTNTSKKEIKTELLQLPNGEKITVEKGGIEKKIVRFLDSEEYLNASEERLQKKWFELDNLSFDEDSTTELLSDGQHKISNLTEILKAFPDTKIEVAAQADPKTDYNGQQSMENSRARTIKDMLVNEGIDDERIVTKDPNSESSKLGHSAHEFFKDNEGRVAIRFLKTRL